MRRKEFRYAVGALSLAVLLGSPLAFSQSTEKPQSQPMMHNMMKQETHSKQKQGEMHTRCKAMMQKRQQMMSKCKAMDAKLDKLAAAMNTATGQKKIEAMAALLNELVQQRKVMHEMMMKMHGRHMHRGMMSGMMGGMSKHGGQAPKMMMNMGTKPAPASAAGASKK